MRATNPPIHAKKYKLGATSFPTAFLQSPLRPAVPPPYDPHSRRSLIFPCGITSASAVPERPVVRHLQGVGRALVPQRADLRGWGHRQSRGEGCWFLTCREFEKRLNQPLVGKAPSTLESTLESVTVTLHSTCVRQSGGEVLTYHSAITYSGAKLALRCAREVRTIAGNVPRNRRLLGFCFCCFCYCCSAFRPSRVPLLSSFEGAVAP